MGKADVQMKPKERIPLFAGFKTHNMDAYIMSDPTCGEREVSLVGVGKCSADSKSPIMMKQCVLIIRSRILCG